MVEKIYLHAGHHKSGSSTIQSYLFENRHSLLQKGYVFPGNSQTNHLNLCKEILKLSTETDKNWEKLWEEVDATKASKLILSADNLEKLSDPEQFEALLKVLKGIDTKVIFYMREQTSRMESGYTQRLKMGGYNGDIEDFINEHKENFHFNERLNLWANYFGVENIVVRPFERSQIGDLKKDFLSLCDIEDASGLVPTADSNSKPSLRALKILRRNGLSVAVDDIQSREIFKEEQKKLFDSIRIFDNVIDPDVANYKLLPFKKAKELKEYYAIGNEEIAQKFLNRKSLFLEDLEPYEHESLDLSQDDFNYWFDYLKFVLKTSEKSYASYESIKTHIIAIAKDEAAYLPEWIHHHLYFGFDRIDVYVNRTTDNSKKILELISKKYPQVHCFSGDEIAEKFPNKFQLEVYNQAYLMTSQDSSHMLCLDIDEFWTPKNFMHSIKDCLLMLNFPDIVSFEWAAKKAEDPFCSPIHIPSFQVNRQKQVKTIFDTSIRVHKVGVHNVWAFGHPNMLADGTNHPKPHKAQVQRLKGPLKEYFILHRPWRSEFEYLGNLMKGPTIRERAIDLGENISLNHTRRGYLAKGHVMSDLDLDENLVAKYNESYKNFLEECNLNKELHKSRAFILDKFRTLYDVISSSNHSNPERLNLVMRGVSMQRAFESADLFAKENGFKNLQDYISSSV